MDKYALVPSDLAEKHSFGGVELGLPQMRICQLWMDNQGNIEKVLRLYKEKFGVELSRVKVERWLTYPQVKGYLEELLADLKIDTTQTKERWIADTVRFRDGLKKGNDMTPAMHKMLGQVKGFLGTDAGTMNLNQEIKIVQADGSE